jgi:hypothetical protein
MKRMGWILMAFAMTQAYQRRRSSGDSAARAIVRLLSGATLVSASSGWVTMGVRESRAGYPAQRG